MTHEHDCQCCAKHPDTFRDASGRLVGKGPIKVDKRDPFWRRVIRWGDVSVADETPAKAAAAVTSGTQANGSKA
ncbi:hypothetical protein [Acetobacter malorum]|uniref:hypothetical protein n=1 Tax=Acetobacter malorum TaxID=178901 RepID=UPI0039E75AC1